MSKVRFEKETFRTFSADWGKQEPRTLVDVKDQLIKLDTRLCTGKTMIRNMKLRALVAVAVSWLDLSTVHCSLTTDMKQPIDGGHQT